MNQENYILTIFIITIIFKALGDGLHNFDYKQPKITRGYLYHSFWLAEPLAFLCLLFFEVPFNDFYIYIIGYILLRFGLFDFAYNIGAKKHFLYVGGTSLVDRMLNKLFKTANSKGILFVLRGFSIMAGMYLIQNN